MTHKEFPADWFAGLPEKMYISRRYNCRAFFGSLPHKEMHPLMRTSAFISATNKHKVASGQDQAAWEKSGWINAQDPRGWFQWYGLNEKGRSIV